MPHPFFNFVVVLEHVFTVFSKRSFYEFFETVDWRLCWGVCVFNFTFHCSVDSMEVLEIMLGMSLVPLLRYLFI